MKPAKQFRVFFEGEDDWGDAWIGSAVVRAATPDATRTVARRVRRRPAAISWEREGGRECPVGALVRVRFMHGDNEGRIAEVVAA